MKNEIPNKDENSTYIRYFLKLLFDIKLNKSKKIADRDKIIKTCHLKVYEKLINCSEGDFGIIWRTESIYLLNELNIPENIDKDNIEFIVFTFNPIHEYSLTHLYLYHSYDIPLIQLVLEQNHKTSVDLTSFLVKKLSSDKNKCIPEQNENKFGEYYFNFCRLDCFHSLTSNSFGCIPFDRYLFFKINILKNGYKLCKYLTILKNGAVFDKF
jgi:hypothetical protein